MATHDPFWFKDYGIIFRPDRLTEFFPMEQMTTIEKLNTIFRLSIYISIILLAIHRKMNVLLIPLFVGLLTLYLYKFNGLKNENLTFADVINNKDESKTKCQKPSQSNPFMNTLISDLNPDVIKKPACKPTEEVKEKIDEYFYKDLFRDVGDLYDKNNSQNRYFTMPNTTKLGVKNGDTVGLANWLYGSGPTCKEDNTQCIGPNNLYSDDAERRRNRDFVLITEDNPLYNYPDSQGEHTDIH